MAKKKDYKNCLAYDEMPLLLREEGGSDFAFVDERLLNEKIEEWNKERKRGKRGEKYRTLYFK